VKRQRNPWNRSRNISESPEGTTAEQEGDEVTTSEAINIMVERIVEQFHPLRITLFGSRARGDAGPDSDVDLLVVLPQVENK